MSTCVAVPLVDFEAFGLDKNRDDINPNKLNELATSLTSAFKNIGFAYLKNHGIPSDQIDEAFKNSKDFFTLPDQVKNKYSRVTKDSQEGWSCLEREHLMLDRPADPKECFDYKLHGDNMCSFWPNAEVPGFQHAASTLMERSCSLSLRLLEVMAMGLGLERDHFVKHHDLQGPLSYTSMRCLWYPPMERQSVKAGQIRCGEHTDYGSVTLLFQDNIGGLEVLARGQDYSPAPPVPGTVLVNIGDLMQRWTGDQLSSTKHRVVIPEKELVLRCARQSIAVFVHPLYDTQIQSITSQYSPIAAVKHAKLRFQETYTY